MSQQRQRPVVLTGLPISKALFAVGQTLPVLLVFAGLFGISNGLVTMVRGGRVPRYGRALASVIAFWRAGRP